eukprot:CAMPEP_0170475814 /NCGR_PEP_ID=MMETSP0123-20130129/17398_1 /TAXON_ID=182087 /ORGANISM="Favella ehrenbergii, Strain Fehren 1" /LENGTH=49 /DNA_ID=CAMNT_0010746567 /DNA_START=14 /DNA_END=163 /DNA_ORIENTATION=+
MPELEVDGMQIARDTSQSGNCPSDPTSPVEPIVSEDGERSACKKFSIVE